MPQVTSSRLIELEKLMIAEINELNGIISN
jgi:hypothetical protein